MSWDPPKEQCPAGSQRCIRKYFYLWFDLCVVAGRGFALSTAGRLLCGARILVDFLTRPAALCVRDVPDGSTVRRAVRQPRIMLSPLTLSLLD